MKYAYRNGIILDGTKDMEPRTGIAVLTNGEIIEDIVPDYAVPAEYEIVDLQGGYLLPGLIDLHLFHREASPLYGAVLQLSLVFNIVFDCFLRSVSN
jgi:dihydroorotase-like cyclic amidohydrolase